MTIIDILVVSQTISTIIAYFEENGKTKYILLSLTLLTSCLLLVSSKLPQKYQQLFRRIMLLMQTITSFQGRMNPQYIAFQAIYQMIIQFQIPPMDNKWVNNGYFLVITSTMLIFKTNLDITDILRSIFCAIGVTYAYSQKIHHFQRQESKNKTNISFPMPSTRALKAQSSTYCRDSPLERWDQMIVIIDDQLKIKRITDKVQNLLDQSNISREDIMEKFIITKIDRFSKIKLGLHKGDCTLIDLLQQIKLISFAMQILVLDCKNQFFNDYLIRILYNEHEFEIQFIDITEREFYVRRNYLYQIMKQLFSTISHEFGTAFNYILALSSTNSDNYEHNFKQIRNQSLIMHHFVLDMVDYNDILGKSFKLQIQQIDILLILHQVKALFEHSIKEKSIQLDIINLANQDIVFSDPRRIKQILIHLLQNAQKFTFQGSIKIIAKVIVDGYVQFIVEDTGIGMSEETANKMRQLFISDYKPESQLSKNAAGFGLGCYLSNKLAIYLSGLPYNAGGGLQFQQLETGMKFWFKVRNNIIPISINFSDQSSGIQKISKNMYFDIRQSNLQKSQSVIRRVSKKQSSQYHQSIMKLESSQMDQVRESKMNTFNNNNIIKNLQTITSNNDQDQINDEEKSKDFPQRLQNKGKTNNKPKSFEITLPFVACRCVPFLIVDDEMINILGLQLLLKQMGFSSDFAFNGREALNKLDINQNSHCKYAGIFMDINMPIMDGYQTTQEINKKYKNNKPCIIACTAFTDADTKQSCYNAGMQQFINKPVNISDLFGIAQFLNL